MSLKDWLGQEYGVGDKVLYAAMSGRSVTMILAEVVEIYDGPKYGYAGMENAETETKVKVQPLSSSRWQQHYGRTRYIDSRTSKGIDPFRRKHLDGGYWENDETKERVFDEDTYRDNRFLTVCHYPYAFKLEGWTHTKSEFKPYVQKVEDGPKPVTLSVIENIVKWTGEVDAHLRIPLSGV